MALVLFLPSPARADADPTQTVRVLLSVGKVSELSVDVEGNYACGNQSFSGGTLTAYAKNGGIELVHSELGLLGTGDSVTVLRQEHSIWAAFFTLENARYGSCRYLGDMIFANDGNDRLMVINRVDMAAYLYGVVGGELRNTHPIEALKAQTVAAKCFALTCLDSAEPYDLDDTPTDQVYKGYHPANENVMAAVDAVSEDLLLYQGNVVRCYYCTSNGGQTITPEMRWGSQSEQSGVYELAYDPYDLEGTEDAVLLHILPDGEDLPEAFAGVLLQLAREQEPAAARILSVRGLRGIHDAAEPEGTAEAPASLAPQAWAQAALLLEKADGTSAAIEVEFSLQALKELGIVHAPNTNVWFVRPEDDGSWTIVFSRAIGHRVGMSHYGMLLCAEQGFTYDEILYYYYPGAQLVHGTPAATEAPPSTPAPTDTAMTAAGTPEPALIPYAEEPSFWDRLFSIWD